MSPFLGRRAAVAAGAVVVAALAAACGSGGAAPGPTASSSSAAPSTATASPSPTSAAPTTVRLLTHDSFVLTESLLEDFRTQTGITIEVVTAGDAGELVNRAILTAGNPEGDVLYGVDNTLLSRALDADVFVDDRVEAIDYGDVCVNVDDTWFGQQLLDPPTTLDQLATPAYAGLLVVENPATSSPGLAFMLATIARYGEDGWLDYWTRLRDNGVTVVNGWTEAYEGEYTAGGGKGTRPLVVSYASSPPAEIVYAADPKPDRPRSSVMTDGCFRQTEYAGVLRGAADPQAAKQVVDFLLSEPVQADLPLSMFVFPVREGTPLPEVFTKFAAVPADPLTLPAEVIAEKRDAWIEQWTDTVLG